MGRREQTDWVDDIEERRERELSEYARREERKARIQEKRPIERQDRTTPAKNSPRA